MRVFGSRLDETAHHGDEYVEELAVLASALQTGNDYVPSLIAAANSLMTEMERRNRC